MLLNNCYSFIYALCWLILVNSTQARVTQEDAASAEELLPSDCVQVCSILSFSEGCGRVQPTGGSNILRQVVLNCIRKQAEQARRSRPVSSILLCSLLQLLLGFSL